MNAHKENFRRLTFSAAVVVALVASAQAQAQTYTLACQYVAAGGLIWETGRWRATGFILRAPFFLTVRGGGLVAESVQQALGSLMVQCVSGYEIETCSTATGVTLFFNHAAAQGTAARLYVQRPGDNAARDTLSVEHFICQRM
jgi:hypothetical protein